MTIIKNDTTIEGDSIINGNLTVNGDVGANNLNISTWDNTTSQFNASSPVWNLTYNRVNELSSSWGGLTNPKVDSVYNTVSTLSGSWNNTTTYFNNSSPSWNAAYTQVNSLSTSWGNALGPKLDSVYSTVSTLSGTWNNTTTYFNNSSPIWNLTYSHVNTLSSSWGNALGPKLDSVYSTVSTLSGTWNNTTSQFNASSPSWNSAYTQVNSLSSSWGGATNPKVDSVYNTVSTLSGSWNNTTTYFNNSSPLWNYTYNAVQNINSDFVHITGDRMSGNLSISSSTPSFTILDNTINDNYAKLYKQYDYASLTNKTIKPGTGNKALFSPATGTNNYAQCYNTNMNDGEWTISYWMYALSDTLGVMMDLRHNDTNSYLIYNSGPGLVVQADMKDMSVGTTFPALSTWTLVTLTKQVTASPLTCKYTIWANSVSGDDPAYTSSHTNIGSFILFKNNSGSFPFNGGIDDVLIWDRALTYPEILYIYNTSTGRYPNRYMPPWDDAKHIFTLDETSGSSFYNMVDGRAGTIYTLDRIGGKTSVPSGSNETIMVKSSGGIYAHEDSTIYIGSSGSRTVIDGDNIRFNLGGSEKFRINTTGKIAFPYGATSGISIMGNISATNLNVNNWNTAYTNIGNMSFTNSTVVSSATANGQYLTLTINGSARAIPLYNY